MLRLFVFALLLCSPALASASMIIRYKFDDELLDSRVSGYFDVDPTLLLKDADGKTFLTIESIVFSRFRYNRMEGFYLLEPGASLYFQITSVSSGIEIDAKNGHIFSDGGLLYFGESNHLATVLGQDLYSRGGQVTFDTRSNNVDHSDMPGYMTGGLAQIDTNWTTGPLPAYGHFDAQVITPAPPALILGLIGVAGLGLLRRRVASIT